MIGYLTDQTNIGLSLQKKKRFNIWEQITIFEQILNNEDRVRTTIWNF